MKPGTAEHPKIKRAAALLGIPSFAAAGLMECLWLWTAKYAPKGNVGRWDDDMIVSAIPGAAELFQPSQVVAALTTARLLDPHDVHRLIVHDWSEHAVDSVHMALGRAGELFADGKQPKLSRLGGDEKVKAEKAIKRARACARRAHTDSAHSLTLPFLTSPSHEETKREEEPPLSPPVKLATPIEWFETVFLPSYPPHRQASSLTTARSEMRKRKLSAEERSAALALLARYKASPKWLEEDGKFVPGVGVYWKNGYCDREPVGGSNGRIGTSRNGHPASAAGDPAKWEREAADADARAARRSGST
jgi:hypothetical protein